MSRDIDIMFMFIAGGDLSFVLGARRGSWGSEWQGIVWVNGLGWRVGCWGVGVECGCRGLDGGLDGVEVGIIGGGGWVVWL